MDKIKKNDDFKIERTKAEINESSKRRFIPRYFKFDYFKATFKKEIIGGISTFLAMVYILSVEPSILKQAPSIKDSSVTMNEGGIFVATAISAFICTFIMGLFANLPIGVAPSMGLNAMFTFNIAHNGIGYEGALIATLISSIFFTILSITKLRTLLIQCIPHSMHLAFGVGIGFFIAYVGLTNIGWFETTGGIPSAQLSNFKLYYPGIIIGMVVLFGSIILFYKKFIAPVALMMLIGFIIAVILANTVNDSSSISASFNNSVWNGWSYDDFSGFGSNIKNAYSEFTNVNIWNKPVMYVSIFIFIILNFFDATGTLKTINIETNKITERNDELSNKSLIIDASSTVIGSVMGVSHMSAYVESCVGISQGARTGFSTLITSLFFLLSLALFPLFKMIPNSVSGAATVFIGTIMIKSITDIEWKKPEIGLGAFFSIIFMITTYSIANGIAVGMIAYTVGCISTKQVKKVPILVWLLDFIFIAYFIAYAFIQ
ncbi:NCS2 family permease [Spiroplasma turonicum]|uniref:Xanthine/uracil permease n=1 Tax=Spiroplasma turonicum TaxID=216946 RepID=A0A0K1P5B7_9MOLU|nr:NCS2 family permease [Spiroplasma turonicum]AKU79374.1 xanthine/uracil permease [Spiroplasma turonicum]ALX70396.1 xanthine/uracil permease [Spiroplasma turonicum]